MTTVTQATPAVNPNNPFDVVLAKLTSYLRECPGRTFIGPLWELIDDALDRTTMYSPAILNRLYGGLMYALDFRGAQFGLEVLDRAVVDGHRMITIRAV